MEPTIESGRAERPMGPLIGSIIVVLLIVLGGLYFWGERLNKENAQSAATPDVALDTLRTQDTSDELAALEADAEATDFSSLNESLDLEEETQ